jgi:hypothetical protein
MWWLLRWRRACCLLSLCSNSWFAGCSCCLSRLSSRIHKRSDRHRQRWRRTAGTTIVQRDPLPARDDLLRMQKRESVSHPRGLQRLVQPDVRPSAVMRLPAPPLKYRCPSVDVIFSLSDKRGLSSRNRSAITVRPAQIPSGARLVTWSEIVREGSNEYAWNGRRGRSLQDDEPLPSNCWWRSYK